MNKADRKQVDSLKSQLEDLVAKFDAIKEQLETLASDEQGKFDNMSEGLQQSESGQRIQQAAQQLQEAADASSPQEAFDALENIDE